MGRRPAPDFPAPLDCTGRAVFRPRFADPRHPMLDLVFILLSLGLFAMAIAYGYACESL